MINDWHGSKLDKDFAVLGNILVAEAVISEAFAAFLSVYDPESGAIITMSVHGVEAAGRPLTCWKRNSNASLARPRTSPIDRARAWA